MKTQVFYKSGSQIIGPVQANEVPQDVNNGPICAPVSPVYDLITDKNGVQYMGKPFTSDKKVHAGYFNRLKCAELILSQY